MFSEVTLRQVCLDTLLRCYALSACCTSLKTQMDITSTMHILSKPSHCDWFWHPPCLGSPSDGLHRVTAFMKWLRQNLHQIWQQHIDV